MAGGDKNNKNGEPTQAFPVEMLVMLGMLGFIVILVMTNPFASKRDQQVVDPMKGRVVTNAASGDTLSKAARDKVNRQTKPGRYASGGGGGQRGGRGGGAGSGKNDDSKCVIAGGVADKINVAMSEDCAGGYRKAD